MAAASDFEGYPEASEAEIRLALQRRFKRSPFFQFFVAALTVGAVSLIVAPCNRRKHWRGESGSRSRVIPHRKALILGVALSPHLFTAEAICKDAHSGTIQTPDGLLNVTL